MVHTFLFTFQPQFSPLTDANICDKNICSHLASWLELSNQCVPIIWHSKMCCGVSTSVNANITAGGRYALSLSCTYPVL